MNPAIRSALPILAGASIMLSLTMGLRQSLGLFMPAITDGLAVTVTQFTMAIAIQNLCWGFVQPLVGAIAPRVGYRAVMVGGGGAYIAGLLLLATAQGFGAIFFGAGILIGIGMACSSTALDCRTLSVKFAECFPVKTLCSNAPENVPGTMSKRPPVDLNMGGTQTYHNNLVFM